MPRKDLQEFLKERLIALDPLRDVTPGSRADTEVIQPVLEYFGTDLFGTNVRSFVLDTLRSVHPELPTLPDGVMDDAVAKPNATLAFALAREITLLRARQKPDVRMHTIESAVSLLGSLFVPFNEGGRAYGNGRLYYISPIAEAVRPENIFYARNGIRFAPTAAQFISKEEMQLNFEKGQYYFDVQLSAVDAGGNGNITAGMLDRAPSIARAVGVTNKFRFSGGAEPDTVETFLAKARNYPTQLSLSVARGIRAIIDRDLPGQAKRIEVVGMGDADMLRDVIKGGNFGPVILSSNYGSFYPSFTHQLHSDLFVTPAPAVGFVTGGHLPIGRPTEDYYLIVHVPMDPSKSPDRVYESRIDEILTNFRLRTVDPIVPLSNSIWWEIRRRVITLSDVPGGILSPTAPDGTITIRDGEIHVGGCTDIYALGDDSSEGSDIDVASDEDELASGEKCNAGGDPGGGGASNGWIRLDSLDTMLLYRKLRTIINDGSGRPRGIKIQSVMRGGSDISNIRCRPGFDGRAHLYGLDQTDSWYSDIITVRIGGQDERFRIQRIQADDTLFDGNKEFVFWAERDIPLGWLVGSNVYIYRPIPDGIVPNRSLLAIGDGTTKYRIIDWGTGWYNSVDPTKSYRGEVRVVDFTNTADPLRQPAAYPVDKPWVIVDDVDIDLSDPKRFRMSGNDVLTVAASSMVTTVSGVNFQARGIQKNDVLRILTGSDKGDHRIIADPSGPGYTILSLESPLKGDGTFRFEVFGPLTPVNLPLIDVDTVNLLSDGGSGATSSIIPYARPLGATSSQFSNAGTGLKARWPSCFTGVIARNTIGSAVVGPFSGVDHMQLEVQSLTWGLISTDIDSGGPYDMGTIAGRQNLLARLNQDLPADFFTYLDEEGNIVLPVSINATDDYILAVNPFDSDERIIIRNGAELLVTGTESKKLWDVAYPTASVFFTSRMVYFRGYNPVSWMTPTIAAWNDLVQVETGLNRTKAQIISAKDQQSHGLIVALYPGVRLLPEYGVTARVGSPSVGLGRTFFRDPTLFQVSENTVYSSDRGDYIPDPRNEGQIFPGFEEDADFDTTTVDEVGLYADPGFPTAHTPINAVRFGIRVFDFIEPTYRDIWFTWDFVVAGGDGDFVVPALTTYTIIFDFDGLPSVSIPIPTGTYNCDQLVTLFNTYFGQILAFKETLPLGVVPGAGWEVLAIRSFNRILRVRGDVSALQGVIHAPADPMDPATYWTEGNLSILAQLHPRLFVSSISAPDPRAIYIIQTISAGVESTGGYGVQFRVKRPMRQRFSVREIKAKVHDSGLYYADVELIGKGAGNEWNIDPDQRFLISGEVESLGYVITPENQVLSHSMYEVPLMSVTPYVTDPLLPSNIPDGEIAVYGAGARVIYRRSPVVSEIQSLANSEDERENNESVLARTMRPCEIFATVSYSGGPTEDAARTQIEALIEAQNTSLDMSEIVTLLLQLGADSVETPIHLAAAYMNQDRSFSLEIAPDRVDVSRLMAFAIGRLTVKRIG